MARRKSNPGEDQPAGQPSFEEALAGLESIVESMEHEQLPLEQLVASYEQGAKLLQRCESILASARQRIELITLRNHEQAAGAPAALPADDADDFPEPSGPPDAADAQDDDIRLF
jgi:exodeoxyribonuclease VII small subunit